MAAVFPSGVRVWNGSSEGLEMDGVEALRELEGTPTWIKDGVCSHLSVQLWGVDQF